MISVLCEQYQSCPKQHRLLNMHNIHAWHQAASLRSSMQQISVTGVMPRAVACAIDQ